MAVAAAAPVRPRRQRAFQRIVAAVREDIFSGRVGPGDRLPHEAALATRFHVSRAALREALRVLELQGLVRVAHGFRGGAFVAQADTSVVSGALETLLRLERVDRAELYVARRYLEPTVAELAARRVDDATLAALAEILAEAEHRLGAGRAAFRTNLAFHSVVAAACGNRVLAIMTEGLLDLLRNVESRDHSDVAANREAHHAHRGILGALRARDAARAHELMAQHLGWLERHFVRGRGR